MSFVNERFLKYVTFHIIEKKRKTRMKKFTPTERWGTGVGSKILCVLNSWNSRTRSY
jgi:hypothetical protein